MSSNNKAENLFEVVIKMDRSPLPPLYQTFSNDLTYLQAIKVVRALENINKKNNYYLFPVIN